MNKISVEPIVIVEGKYDKITLENIIDATIIVCDGFQIFKNDEQKKALRAMAAKHGAIILTDSDRAGAVLRSYLQTILQGCKVYSLYIPAVAGKEARKAAPSKEGYLGVEGMKKEVLRQLFEEFRAEPIKNIIQAVDLYENGLTGAPGSKERKARLLEAMQLPPHLSNNALLREINRRFDTEGFVAFLKTI